LHILIGIKACAGIYGGIVGCTAVGQEKRIEKRICKAALIYPLSVKHIGQNALIYEMQA